MRRGRPRKNTSFDSLGTKSSSDNENERKAVPSNSTGTDSPDYSPATEMPKNKKPVEPTRTRRQASKEALKQLQLLLDDEEDDAFVIPEDGEGKKETRLDPPPPPPLKKRAISPIPMDSPPPKKKYKLSHRKSSDGNDRDVIVLKSISNSHYVPKEDTLELDCFVDELSEVQKAMRNKAEMEEKELQDKLNELLNNKKVEVVYKGGISSAVEVNEIISNSDNKSLFNPKELPELGELSEPQAPTYQLVMDPSLGLIVGSVTNVTKSTKPVQIQSSANPKGKLQISSAVKAVATLPPSDSPPPTRNMRTRRGLIATPHATVQTRTNNTPPTRAGNLGVMTRGNSNTSTSNSQVATRRITQVETPPTIQTRGMKSVPTIQARNKPTPPSGKRAVAKAVPEKQLVDLTSEEIRNHFDNREISFNKLQEKTFPSLMVVARPHLRVTDLTSDRAKLDSKVKSVLMHPPTKFTEWLIQQGLIRAEQKCPLHSNTQLKLGMYSDVAKFPFSGGYVWISECCPQRFVSVFNGSIFEGSPHPPVVILKLIYHWSCQTNIQNVTQWVKVENLYVKGVYTWIRGVCTLAVQSKLRQLGGPGTRIEVGVISLGTTSHDGNQRQVKVEVLGVMESSTKYVRLRAVEPMPDGDRNFRKKFSKILEPVLQWVHPDSTIVTDLTVDKATLNHMGFNNVVQTTSNDYSQSNRTIMEYLRRIVPRMFQNTLSLLSRQIIQQFLDELVWREWFGITSQMAFDNIITHLAEQTRLHLHSPLVIKLNKVAANPFKYWSNGPVKQQVPSNTTTTLAAASSVQDPTTSTATPAKTSAATSTKSLMGTTPVKTPLAATSAKTPVEVVKKYGRGKKNNSPQVQVVQERPTKPVSPDVPEQMVPLENYYYGTIDPVMQMPAKITLNMKCPFCKSTFDNNIQLQNHLFKHAHNVSNDAYLCQYCLTSVSTANELISHVNKCHPGGTKFDYGFVCLICEIHYMNPFVLGKHMSKEHIPHELPYQCGSCPYRCSNHKQVIDHFYQKHDGGSSIQCPFCLKSTTVWSSGRNVSQNIHYFIQHLQKHQKKQFAKRCGKCNLWFVQKEVLKEHQQKMHISLRGKAGLIPYPSPRNGVMVPKSKVDKNPCDAEVINFSSLFYNISNSTVCKECNQAIKSSKHFPSFDNCQNPNCQYSTCCAIAMMTHNAKCKGLNSVIPPESLPFEMFCVCGFRDSDGNSMAKHLALCEKKSAYPSEAEAKSASVMHSMLDILGLVRKPEETKSEKQPNEIEEKTEVSKDSNKHVERGSSVDIDILSDEETESNPRNISKTTDVLEDKLTESEILVEDDNLEKPPSEAGIIKETEDQLEMGQKCKDTDVIELDDDEDVIINEKSNESQQCILTVGSENSEETSEVKNKENNLSTDEKSHVENELKSDIEKSVDDQEILSEEIDSKHLEENESKIDQSEDFSKKNLEKKETDQANDETESLNKEIGTVSTENLEDQVMEVIEKGSAAEDYEENEHHDKEKKEYDEVKEECVNSKDKIEDENSNDNDIKIWAEGTEMHNEKNVEKTDNNTLPKETVLVNDENSGLSLQMDSEDIKTSNEGIYDDKILNEESCDSITEHSIIQEHPENLPQIQANERTELQETEDREIQMIEESGIQNELKNVDDKETNLLDCANEIQMLEETSEIQNEPKNLDTYDTNLMDHENVIQMPEEASATQNEPNNLDENDTNPMDCTNEIQMPEEPYVIQNESSNVDDNDPNPFECENVIQMSEEASVIQNEPNNIDENDANLMDCEEITNSDMVEVRKSLNYEESENVTENSSNAVSSTDDTTANFHSILEPTSMETD